MASGRGEVPIRVDVAGVNLLPALCAHRVDGLEVGDVVFGFALTGGGSYAETAVLSAAYAARIPTGLSATVAASLPVAGTTVVDVLDQLDLPAGATVLANGVGSGVGHAVARLAAERELR